MDNEVKSAVGIAVDLIVTTVLLALVVVISIIGFRFVSVKEQNDSIKEIMQDRVTLFRYDGKDRLSSSDVVECISLYNRVYKFEIKTKLEMGNMRLSQDIQDWLADNTDYYDGFYSVEISYDREDLVGEKLWSISTLRDMLSSNDSISSEFKSELLWGLNGEESGGLYNYSELQDKHGERLDISVCYIVGVRFTEV